MVYNPLGRPQKIVIHLPVSSSGSYQLWKVGSPKGDIKTINAVIALSNVAKDSSQYIVSFDTGPLPPLGASVFKVRFIGGSESTGTLTSPVVLDHRLLGVSNNEEDVILSNGLIRAVFDR